jgi:uncharacterized NAD(P)/FAD-binding protein YdhS
MIDAALTLHARGLRARMHAVSRRGLLPLSHRIPGSPPTFAHRPPDIEDGPASARAYLRSVRRHVALLAADGIDWREVIGALRPITPALWRRLPMPERRRFLRHVRPYWEVHRHRIAPELASAFARLLESGSVYIHAARLLEAREHRDRLRISIRRRGSTEVQRIEASHLINCTGPQTDLRRVRDPLMAMLEARGLIRPDALGLGLETGDHGALIDADGRTSKLLFHVGPLLRATEWEAVAVPELRLHAAALIARLIAELESPLVCMDLSCTY